MFSFQSVLKLASLQAFVSSMSLAFAGTQAPIVCPITAELTLKDQPGGSTSNVTLARTVAAYGGEGSWGPRWSCDYEVTGEQQDSILLARFLTGQPTGGARFEFIRSENTPVKLPVYMNRMHAEAGIEAFVNSSNQPVKVGAVQWTWSDARHFATQPRDGDLETRATATFYSATVNGVCIPNWENALQPVRAEIQIHGTHRQTLPVNWSESPNDLTNSSCVYTVFAELLDSHAEQFGNDGHWMIQGPIAEVLARSGYKHCSRIPGSGIDTACVIESN